jgi:hypothetical protein
MTFLEFLDALGESRYRKLIEEKNDASHLNKAFHQDLVELLKKYYFIGGMPEVVKYYVETKDLFEIRNIQKEIIDSYILDFAKHAHSTDIPKLTIIWENIVLQLAKENKKFIFSVIKKSARARDYENAIIWLEDSGLIYRAFLVNAPKYPLKAYTDRNSFKVYTLDVGLLSAMSNLSSDILSKQDMIFQEFKGVFVENYIASQLKSIFNLDLFYWKSEGAHAEVDFICDIENKIYPLEVKAGINTKSKSLKSYYNKFNPNLLTRSTLLNFSLDGKICNIPLYAIACYKNLIKLIK